MAESEEIPKPAPAPSEPPIDKEKQKQLDKELLISIAKTYPSQQPEEKGVKGPKQPISKQDIQTLLDKAVPLLKQGANPNKTRDQDQRGCLHHACEKGIPELVQALLEYGADIDVKDKYGLTALGWASRSGNLECAKILLEKGANLNSLDNNKRTAFLRSIDKGHLEMAKLHLEYKADVDIQDENGQAAIHLALLKDNIKLCMMLISEYNANIQAFDKNHRTVLHYAADKGLIDFSRILLKYGSNPNMKDNGGRVALHYAVKSGSLDLVQVLVENSADLNIRTENGRTALHHAADNSYTNIGVYLVDNGADSTIIDNDKRTPLHYSAAQGDLELAEKLLDNGCPINSKDNNDWTALHHAANQNQIKMVDLLLKRKADVKAKDKKQQEPFHIAAEKEYTELAVKLYKKSLPQLQRSREIKLPKLDKQGIHCFIPAFCDSLLENEQLNLKIDTTSTYLSYHDVLLLVQALRKREKNLPKKCCGLTSDATVDLLLKEPDFQTQRLALSVSGVTKLSDANKKKASPWYMQLIGSLICVVLWPMFAVVNVFDNLTREFEYEIDEHDGESYPVFDIDAFMSLTLQNLDFNEPPRYNCIANIYDSTFGYLILRFFSFFILLPIIFYPFLASFLILSSNSSDEIYNNVFQGIYFAIIVATTLYFPVIIHRDSRYVTLDLPQPYMTRFTFLNAMMILFLILEFFQIIALSFGPLKIYPSNLYLETFFNYLLLRIEIDSITWLYSKAILFIIITALWVILASYLFYISNTNQPYLLIWLPFVGLFVTLFTQVFYLTIIVNLMSLMDCSYTGSQVLHSQILGLVCWSEDHQTFAAICLFLLAIFTWSTNILGSFFAENYSASLEVHFIESHMAFERALKTCLAICSLALTLYPEVGLPLLLAFEIVFLTLIIYKKPPSDNATVNQFKVVILCCSIWTVICNMIAFWGFDNPTETYIPFILLMIGWGVFFLIFFAFFALGVYWNYPVWGQQPGIFDPSTKYKATDTFVAPIRLPSKTFTTKGKPKPSLREEKILPGEVPKVCQNKKCKETVAVFCEECSAYFCLVHDQEVHSKGDKAQHFRPHLISGAIDEKEKDIEMVFDSDED